MPSCRSSAPALPSINCPALRTVELSATRPAGRTVYRYKWLGRPTTSNLQFCINWARPERRHLEPDAVELFLCSVSAYLRATHRVITLAFGVAVLPFAGFAQQSLPKPAAPADSFSAQKLPRIGPFRGGPDDVFAGVSGLQYVIIESKRKVTRFSSCLVRVPICVFSA